MAQVVVGVFHLALGERERDCVDCDQTFIFKSTVAVRRPSCRRQRKLEQRRV
jgi:hypothetical protein